MDKKLWKRLIRGATPGNIRKRGIDSAGMSLDNIIEAIAEGESLLIPKEQPFSILKVPPNLSGLEYYRFFEQFRNMESDKLETQELRRGTMTNEQFQRYGPQFNLQQRNSEDAIRFKTGPQTLMRRAIGRRKWKNLTINDHYMLIASRGFHWKTGSGEHAVMGLGNLLKGWNMAAILLNERNNYQLVYSNPPSGFKIKLPSTLTKFDPDPRKADYDVWMRNFADNSDLELNYADWHKLTGDVNQKNLARNVSRYEMPEWRVDHRSVANSVLRVAFSDSNRSRFGLYDPVADHPLNRVHLNIAITPYQRLIDFYINFLNNVTFEAHSSYKFVDSHVDFALSLYMHKLNGGFKLDEPLKHLPDTINYIIQKQHQHNPEFEMNKLPF